MRPERLLEMHFAPGTAQGRPQDGSLVRRGGRAGDGWEDESAGAAGHDRPVVGEDRSEQGQGAAGGEDREPRTDTPCGLSLSSRV